ncbi:MAG TPA: hypothetical protein VG841_08125 [Caulobacterales bacterium]|nr:hypothetical protein [Caulobacterales bacterium]
MCRFLLAAAVAAVAFSAATFAAPVIAPAHAQSAQQQHYGPDLAAQHAAMDRLAGMAGDWTGVADVIMPTQRHVFQTEHIERDMDGLLLVIHGNGYASADHSGAPIFKAFGVISYDDRRQIYEFRVYNDGNAATAEARFLDDGRLQWTMAFGPVRFRYTITLTAAHWNEIGEMSRDGGQTWTRTIEMNLDKS